MDERVDIVNEADEVVSEVTKQEAHEKGLLHRCVLALLVTPNDEWIFVRQASDRQDPGQFVFPMGGHVMAGESIENALRREVMEELGLSNFEHKFIGAYTNRRTVLGRDENHHFKCFEIYSSTLPNLGSEAVEYRAFTKDSLCSHVNKNPREWGPLFYHEMKLFYPEVYREFETNNPYEGFS